MCYKDGMEVAGKNGIAAGFIYSLVLVNNKPLIEVMPVACVELHQGLTNQAQEAQA